MLQRDESATERDLRVAFDQILHILNGARGDAPRLKRCQQRCFVLFLCPGGKACFTLRAFDCRVDRGGRAQSAPIDNGCDGDCNPAILAARGINTLVAEGRIRVALSLGTLAARGCGDGRIHLLRADLVHGGVDVRTNA